MSTKTIKFLFYFVIYVILFIAVAFYPDQTIVAIPIADTLFEFVSIPTFFHSCLLIPFIGNTVLLIYFFKDEIKNFFKF